MTLSAERLVSCADKVPFDIPPVLRLPDHSPDGRDRLRLSSHACRLAKRLTPFGSQEKSMGVSLPCDFLLSLFLSPPAPMLFAFFLARKLRSQACSGMEDRWLTGAKEKKMTNRLVGHFPLFPAAAYLPGRTVNEVHKAARRSPF